MGSKRWRHNQRMKCGCMGYWFQHRKGSGSCELREDKLSALLVKVRREGGDTLQAIDDWHRDNPGTPSKPGDPCPF
jgi:hypothetical protein